MTANFLWTRRGRHIYTTKEDLNKYIKESEQELTKLMKKEFDEKAYKEGKRLLTELEAYLENMQRDVDAQKKMLSDMLREKELIKEECFRIRKDIDEAHRHLASMETIEQIQKNKKNRENVGVTSLREAQEAAGFPKDSM